MSDGGFCQCFITGFYYLWICCSNNQPFRRAVALDLQAINKNSLEDGSKGLHHVIMKKEAFLTLKSQMTILSVEI